MFNTRSTIHDPRFTTKGLTLIELLISILLISLMLIAVWAIYSTGYKVYYGQLARENIKSQASLALTTMTGELRQALAISAATDKSITFSADIAGDGVGQSIQYIWSGVAGAPLNKVIGTTTTSLIRSVNSLTFTYYNTNNVILSFPVTVSQVKLVLIDATASSGSESFHLRTKVYLQCV